MKSGAATMKKGEYVIVGMGLGERVLVLVQLAMYTCTTDRGARGMRSSMTGQEATWHGGELVGLVVHFDRQRTRADKCDCHVV